MTQRITGTKNITPSGDQTISAPGGSINLITTASGQIFANSSANVGNPNNVPYDPNNIFDTAADRKEGAAYFTGGVGIEKDLNVGGFIYGRLASQNTSTQSIITATNADRYFYPTFTDTLGPNGGYLYGDNQSDYASSGLRYNPATGKLLVDQLSVASTASSSSPVTGAFTVTGGAGILGDVWIGGSEYVDTLYTKFIRSQQGPVSIQPASGLTEILGDIRVRGVNPIGTAPEVTNVLYVTVDGDDTNDGRAQDASRACRTIGGALKSPYYQPGTQIQVSAGHYLENNPLLLKPYTSVKGSDIRTTFIEPINKTQDLFHLQSGCYLNYMTFLNGRSGLLPGQYAPGYNRGAYATAFPPQTGADRIDLFHSPYVQNVTNQSGPWLVDGTMFVPDQTVQIPAAVGLGTWDVNTTSIVISVTTGTVSLGQSINAGQHNQGFFNARTLLLANKPFLQAQVVAYVNATFPGFDYNQQLCYRDTGILVENMAYDMAFGGNEKSIESGRAYYRGVTSVIAGQEAQTVAAVNYLSTLSQKVVTNSLCTVLAPPASIPSASQVVNTVLTGGSISTASVRKLFDITTGIILNGPDSAPQLYNSAGPDSAFVSAEILMQANRAFIQENVVNYINYNLCVPPKTLPYNQIKCRRDTGIIIDSVASDLLFSTSSQSTFAGLQYYSQNTYTGSIPAEITATIAAISYLKDLSLKVVQNITTATDALVGISRYTNGVQTTASNHATSAEVSIIGTEFDLILSILRGNTAGLTDMVIPNGSASNLPSVRNTVNLLLANTGYLATEVVASVQNNFPDLSFDSAKCARDVGYIVESVAFDLLYGGNRQAIQSGLSYYANTNNDTVIPNEIPATVDAFTFIGGVARALIQGNDYQPLQGSIKPVLGLPVGAGADADMVVSYLDIITNIIGNGPGVAGPLSPMPITPSSSASTVNAWNILKANREFIAAEVIAHLDQTYNPGSFNYNQDKCYRDTGLIIDAVSQDILLGGNQKSLEAGSSYWNAGYNYIAGQESTTTQALNYARDIALQIIANTPVTPVTGTVATQVINPFFSGGTAYMPQEAVQRNFKIITDIITYGPEQAPPPYAGGGLFSLTGLNGSDVKIAPTVTAINDNMDGTITVGLSTATVGFGTNATLYFGDTYIFPLQDGQVEELSYQYTGSRKTWDQRKVDKLGSMGGSLVDGAVISDRSPIQSFVYDAYTQVNQGGYGVHITNNGYAQLVSVFTIFCSVGVQCDNGGKASIVNSNANFGDLCLVAKGYGPRDFSGTVFNPINRAYPFNAELDPYYPNGYFPGSGGLVEVFVPDTGNRPHIGQVMEIIPPESYVNNQGFSGFLNTQPSTSTLTTGTIELVNIDTTDVYIGNTVYIRDQFGSEKDANGIYYVPPGTTVSDVNYNSISLTQALTSGGGDPTNSTYFTLYFCGNAYYTVQTSNIAQQPYAPSLNILSANSDPRYQGPSVNQISAHIASIEYLKIAVNAVIANTAPLGGWITQSNGQTILPAVKGGHGAQAFVDLRFGYMTSIIGAANLAAAQTVVPSGLITTSGTIPTGAGSAVTLITANLDFLANEIVAYVNQNYAGQLAGSMTDNQTAKCARDVKLILQQLLYDLESGGNYNSVYSGLSYWSRPGTYHVVELGEAVTDTSLFPDGSTVNFYERSYISASGYVFEYVGAGSNYGALPQRGIADPIQGRETISLNSGKVFFTSTDQNGDFRIGTGLVISQATGVLSGRTFVQSLYANMTPFILAIE